MSQYLSSSNASVSVISYSPTSLPRLFDSRTSCSYGYSRWGYLYRYFMYECVGVESR